MRPAETFQEYRPLLFSIAYRMLGSASDAEDMIQEAYLRWQRAPEGEVRSDRAFLSTMVTRMCIDQLRSARVRRETYVGPWLPEPLVGQSLSDSLSGGDAADPVTRAETVSMAFLVLLESLNPIERAVFLLREVFEYDYPEIARIVEKSEANCRQILRRARDYVQSRRPRFDPSPERKAELVRRFAVACDTGDLPGLISLLDRDIILWSDGGGKAAAARNPIYGADAVARFLIGVRRKFNAGVSASLCDVNGQPGLILGEEATRSVIAFDIVDGSIQALRIVRNPDKLQQVEVDRWREDGSDAPAQVSG